MLLRACADTCVKGGPCAFHINAHVLIPRVFTYPLIEPLTYFELCRELVDHDSTIRWCQMMKLLPSSKTCSCGRAMNLVKRKSSPDSGGAGLTVP